MVLTEAFAAGTPVVASDIAGYRDVVADGGDGLLVPRGDATRLAETLRDLALDPARVTARLGRAAARSAERYAWPRVAAEVAERLRGGARRCPQPVGARAAPPCASARCPPTAAARPARRLPSLEPPPARAARPALRFARRGAVGVAALAAVGGTLPGARAHRAATRSATRCWPRARPGCSSALGAHVRLDVPARRLLARDPQGRAARRAAALRRRHAGHVDRRADVGHAARAPRRALARADRRPPARPRARARCPSCSARSSRRRCSTCSRS